MNILKFLALSASLLSFAATAGSASSPEGGTPGAERRGYVDVPMGQMHFRDRGQGPVLLLLHQTPWFSVQWSAVMPILAEAGYRVVAPDTPGFGFSPPPAGQPDLEDYAANLDVLLEQLGIERAIVIGHHTGAGLALAFADRHPERTACLVLNGLPLYTDEARAERLARVQGSVVLEEDGSHLSERFAWIRREIMGGQGSLEAVQWSTLSFFLAEDSERRAYRALFAYAGSHRALQALEMPTLLLADLQDSLVTATRWAHELRPDIPYVELPTGGSHVMLDYPQDWADAVLTFLRDQCAPAIAVHPDHDSASRVAGRE